MEVDTKNLALTKALTEIKNISPDFSKTFLFQRNNRILVRDECADEEGTNVMVEAFESLYEKANAISGIESLALHGTGGRLDITQAKDYYLATVTSKETDEKTLDSLTRVIAPTIIKLVQEIYPSNHSSFEKTAKTEKETSDHLGKQLPDLLPSQLLVESLSRFRKLRDGSEMVRFDSALIERWKGFYGDKVIEKVIIEDTVTGKKLCSKFKIITNPKFEGKGIIQMPESLQKKLEVEKGSLILVKPIVN